MTFASKEIRDKYLDEVGALIKCYNSEYGENIPFRRCEWGVAYAIDQYRQRGEPAEIAAQEYIDWYMAH